MSVYALVLSKCNHSNYVTQFINSRICVKRVTKRTFSFMSANQQQQTSKSFVFINIPENGNVSNTRRNFFTSIFRRNRTAIKGQKNVNNPPTPSTTRQRFAKSEVIRLLSLAKPEKWKLFGGIFFLILSSTVTMAIPFSLGKVLDIIYTSTGDEEQARTRLNHVGLILLGVFVFAAICNFGRVFFMSIAGYRMTQALRKKVFNSIMKQEQAWFDQRPTGELINRLSADTQLVGQALSNNISDGLRSLVMVTAGSGMMFYMSPELALVGLAIVPPLAGVAVVYGRFVRKISRNVQDSLAEATKVAEERIGNMRTVKTFAQEAREMSTYSNAIKHVLDLAYKEVKARSVFFGMVSFSGHIIIISVLYYGGVMVSSQTITVGNLSSFLLYAAYIGISVSGLSSFYTELNKSLGAASRIWEIIDREPVIPVEGGLVPLISPQGHIHFKDITFSYPTRSDTLIFDNLQLEITPGLMVAVVGSSGSGKSTLGSLLLRLYDPQEGGVYVDGYNVKDLNPVWLKRHIGTVSQEPVLFSCSIKDNILYGAEDPEKVTEEELVRVSKEANVYEFVRQMPDGFDTLVGERGVMLSGGQKQRVAIARALIKNPKILLLDEATSALDAHSEHLVQDALERIMQGRTVLTIAHRLSTIQNADVIAVLKDGKFVEQGKYQDLISRESGAFRELIQHQTFKELEQT